MAINREYTNALVSKVRSGEITREDINAAMEETKLSLQILSASAQGRRANAEEIAIQQDEIDSGKAALLELDLPAVGETSVYVSEGDDKSGQTVKVVRVEFPAGLIWGACPVVEFDNGEQMLVRARMIKPF